MAAIIVDFNIFEKSFAHLISNQKMFTMNHFHFQRVEEATELEWTEMGRETAMFYRKIVNHE